MLLPILIVAAGLLIALTGMIITFIIVPPIFGADIDLGHYSPTNRERRKRGFSKAGVSLLASGTFVQLVGTVLQVIRLACRG
jgi:hypothetical protein